MFKGPAQHTGWLRLNNGVLGRYLTKGRLPLAHEGDHFAFGFPRFLRIESPRISMRWALCTSRSGCRRPAWDLLSVRATASEDSGEGEH